jgi:hypothetical protein
MPQSAVFFSDGGGFGIVMVQALDAAHAEDITRAQHPTGRLSAVLAELLDDQNRHKLLRTWLNGEGDAAGPWLEQMGTDNPDGVK